MKNWAVLGILVLLAVIAFELRDVGPKADPWPGYHDVVPCPGHMSDSGYLIPGKGWCDDPNSLD